MVPGGERGAMRQIMPGFVIAVLWSTEATAQAVPPDATLLAIAVADLRELPESVAGDACVSIGEDVVSDTALRAVRAQAPKLRWRAFEKECVFEGLNLFSVRSSGRNADNSFDVSVDWGRLEEGEHIATLVRHRTYRVRHDGDRWLFKLYSGDDLGICQIGAPVEHGVAADGAKTSDTNE
jgi:hypothetical protein